MTGAPTVYFELAAGLKNIAQEIKDLSLNGTQYKVEFLSGDWK